MELELQQEEREVLRSIYEGDTNFIQLSDNTFQYKVGEDGSPKSFLLEIRWDEGYPNVLPKISLDSFYNKHVFHEVKNDIKEKVEAQALDLLGTAMTYTLFEWVKENAASLMPEQTSLPGVTQCQSDLEPSGQQIVEANKSKTKEQQLSKNQKRKLQSRLDGKGELLRGWNWVDIVKHLSQTRNNMEGDS